MNAYEIRILNKSQRPKVIVHVAHVSDFAAARSARRIAGSQAVEVRRDVECIYRDRMHDDEHPQHAA